MRREISQCVAHIFPTLHLLPSSPFDSCHPPHKDGALSHQAILILVFETGLHGVALTGLDPTM